MEKEIRRVDSILQSLLSVARPQELRPHECELREMMERVKRSIQPLLDERSMHLNIEGGPAVVLADEGMIHQVLLNLVKNAVEASPERGLIRVFLEDAGPEDEARGLQVRVEDSGTGVDPEILPRLFEPFASRKAGGTGLGLYVCHNFVERHGGRLTAENLAAGGARFTLVLPQSPALIGG
jgi:two-component system nitrogen regulation sensor histidine kinase GlnL